MPKTPSILRYEPAAGGRRISRAAYDLQTVAISDSVLRAIGRVTVNFNLVESTLASAIWVLLGVDQFTGQRVTARPSFRGRLDLLHHLPLSHGGRIAWVDQQQQPFRDGHVEDDAFELVAVRGDLGVQSRLSVPLAVSDDCRGVLVVRSAAPDHFGEADLELLRFVAYWVALVAQQHTSTGERRTARLIVGGGDVRSGD